MERSTTILFSTLVLAIRADVYMQYPPGSNNRLAEGGGNRNNNNRLMDTQNNAKGGYGYGGTNNGATVPVKYMAGSKLSMAWTSQHSCGSENAECQIVVQYMCNDGQGTTPAGLPPTGQSVGEGPLRDGTDGQSPDPDDPDPARGLHEPTSFFQACEARQRNKGLYVSDQNLNNNQGARATRQNPNGARSGLECAEERDYYPYWHPTPWKDIAIMTNNKPLCDKYRTESQNVKSKGYCETTQNGQANNGNGANNANDCPNGQWKEVEAFNIPPPMCLTAPFQRDNHLGNGPGPGGNEVLLNLSIPTKAGLGGTDDASNCAIRLRYNITTSDTRACEDPAHTTEATCRAAGKIWSAAFVDSTFNDNNNGLAAATTSGKIEQNPQTSLGGLLTDNQGGTDSLLELAINTNQYGRTFQDRTHRFSIRKRPEGVPANANIYNLNVKGKRGNIVQTYPATEYDFHPVDLVVGKEDWVHFQWTGNDNTNNNGNNNGEGTNNEDRHNIVEIDNAGMDVPSVASGGAPMFQSFTAEWNPEENGQFAGPRDAVGLTKQFALVKQSGCNANPNNDQQRSNCEKLNSAAHTVDLGMLKFKPGEYRYMSSRNNNFSNRAQKAKITVANANSVPPLPPVKPTGKAVTNQENAASTHVFLEWAPSGSDWTTDSNRDLVRGTSEQADMVVDYFVEYSPDGENWMVAPNCKGGATSCMVKELPAGTPVQFRVKSGGVGGWSDPSEVVVVKTEDSPLSESCRAQLAAQASGQYLTTGAIVAIVFGVLAAIGLIVLVIFMARRNKPPPPPEFKEVPTPAYQ